MKIAEIFIILCATFSLLALPCAAQNDSVSLAHGGLSASNYNMQNPKESLHDCNWCRQRSRHIYLCREI